MTGDDPGDMEVDHIDLNKSNNKGTNLRLATKSQNLSNRETFNSNVSGTKGVRWHKRRGKFIANIRVNGKLHHIGYFEKAEDAFEAVKNLREKLHGDFCNHR